MELKFSKMHGAGNDYIYVNGFDVKVDDPAAVSRKVSHRHFGIGSDGLILILPSDKADVRMQMFNADGSEGKMCGNGVRCVAKYAYDRGLAKKPSITVETLSGIKHIDLIIKNGVAIAAKVDMGAPILECIKIPVKCQDNTFISMPFVVEGKQWIGTAVSMGNPHCVIFTDHIDEMDLERMGPHFENNELFPDRVNTEFVEVISPNTLKMRVWERGSGETLACGTGACATVVAACLNNKVKRGEDITVKLRGGDLVINWSNEGNVFMTGPAEFICDGIAYI